MRTHLRLAPLAIVPILMGVVLATAGCLATDHADRPTVYVDDWANALDRPWPGPDWHANRIQDWRVSGGRLECLTGTNPLAGRTAHLLTRRVEPESDRPVELGVTVEALETGDLVEGACVGLLIGMGGPETDYRATALVQQVPAPGGGTLVAVDAAGRIVVRKFSESIQRAGAWVLPRNVDLDNLPLIASSEPVVLPELSGHPLRFELVWEAGDGDGRLTVSARTSGPENSTTEIGLTVASFPRESIAGGISLFSARGADGKPESGPKRGFAFSDFRLSGARAHPEQAWGPVLGTLYTVAREASGAHSLRLTAQLPVLGDGDAREARLLLADDPGNWRLAATALIEEGGSWTVPFHVPDYRADRTRFFRVEYPLRGRDGETVSTYDGIVRAEPGADEELVLASLSCVKNQVGPVRWDPLGLWFPHDDIADAVAFHDPDLLFFAGDQIYEGDLTPPQGGTILDYHTKWQRFLWSFGELTRRSPTVTIPDDHDVFHGNLWGAGGVRARGREGLRAQDAGGYKLPAEFVNAVHATLTSHLPPTRVTPVIGQGITTYTTTFSYGGLDLLVLADRMWKDSPTMKVPAGKFVNGWPQAEGFDPRESDVEGAQLLGAEQEALLDGWSEERAPGTWMKVALSQSPFSCLHSLPASSKSDSIVGRLESLAPGTYAPDDRPVSDGDSNGWPQSARDRAVRSLARAGALHLAGDQHLGSVVQYGLDSHRDGTVAFTSPAMANTWPRRWMPAEGGSNRAPGAPRYTGDFIDGFGNKVTMLAAANPSANGLEPALLYNRAPGYGIVRFDPTTRTATLEAWPRWVDPREPGNSGEQFPGWPIEVDDRARPK